MPMKLKCCLSGLALMALLALPTQATATEPPLPPLGTPLAQTVDDLAWRSARGEPEAACRLAMELAACAVDLHLSWLLCGDREGTPTVCEEHRGFISRYIPEVDWSRDVAMLQAHCDGAPIVTARELLARFRRAALLGSKLAIGRYMAAPGWMAKPSVWNWEVPSMWPEDSPEAHAVEQHHPMLAWALLNAGSGPIAGSMAQQRYWKIQGEIWEPSGVDQSQILIEAMALMHYDVAVRHALGWGMHGSYLGSTEWEMELKTLAGLMSAEQIEQAQAMARHWRETITR